MWGPVLLLAEQAQAINKADAYVRALIGLTSTTNWRTVFPHEIEHYSVVSRRETPASAAFSRRQRKRGKTNRKQKI